VRRSLIPDGGTLPKNTWIVCRAASVTPQLLFGLWCVQEVLQNAARALGRALAAKASGHSDALAKLVNGSNDSDEASDDAAMVLQCFQLRTVLAATVVQCPAHGLMKEVIANLLSLCCSLCRSARLFSGSPDARRLSPTATFPHFPSLSANTVKA